MPVTQKTSTNNEWYVYSHTTKAQILQSYHTLKVLPITTGTGDMRIIVCKIRE